MKGHIDTNHGKSSLKHQAEEILPSIKDKPQSKMTRVLLPPCSSKGKNLLKQNIKDFRLTLMTVPVSMPQPAELCC